MTCKIECILIIICIGTGKLGTFSPPIFYEGIKVSSAPRIFQTHLFQSNLPIYSIRHLSYDYIILLIISCWLFFCGWHSILLSLCYVLYKKLALSPNVFQVPLPMLIVFSFSYLTYNNLFCFLFLKIISTTDSTRRLGGPIAKDRSRWECTSRGSASGAWESLG